MDMTIIGPARNPAGTQIFPMAGGEMWVSRPSAAMCGRCPEGTITVFEFVPHGRPPHQPLFTAEIGPDFLDVFKCKYCEDGKEYKAFPTEGERERIMAAISAFYGYSH